MGTIYKISTLVSADSLPTYIATLNKMGAKVEVETVHTDGRAHTPKLGSLQNIPAGERLVVEWARSHGKPFLGRDPGLVTAYQAVYKTANSESTAARCSEAARDGFLFVVRKENRTHVYSAKQSDVPKKKG